MKGHKHHRKHHEAGGVADWKKDEHTKPERYDESRVEGEAEGKKHGGRAKRKRGGHVHHEHGKELGHAKHLGHIHGEHGKHHAGRKPRKSGGRTGSNMKPLSSAHSGMEPKGHKSVEID